MSANIDAVLARLDEMNNGEINYEVYRELHDLVSAIEDDVQAPIELFPGTLEALDALSIRARTTSPDAATAESEQRAWAIAGHLERDREAVKAERDAALAAVERVQETLSLHNPNGRLVKEVLAALDGAPEPEWEWGWMADKERRASMSPRGPRLLIDGHPHTPEEIARFPRGQRVRRVKAGPWLPVEGEKP